MCAQFAVVEITGIRVLFYSLPHVIRRQAGIPLSNLSSELQHFEVLKSSHQCEDFPIRLFGIEVTRSFEKREEGR